MIYRELLLGCGHRREKLMGPPGKPLEWQNLTTLDSNPNCGADIGCDLDMPYGAEFRANSINSRMDRESVIDMVDGVFLPDIFDEVHAYEVLEHLGSQGDYKTFLWHFSEIHRILKPGGYLFATCPSRYSPWLWGDPGHRRVILPESLVFLSQAEYRKQCDEKKSPMSDYRHLYKADFKIVASTDNHVTHMFCLKAIK